MRGYLIRILPNWTRTRKRVGAMTTHDAALVAIDADARVVESYGEEIDAPASDPATLAFSAVEDALKDSVFGDARRQRARRPPPQPTSPARPAVERTERARAADKIAGQTGSVANDDRFQASQDPLWPAGPLARHARP